MSEDTGHRSGGNSPVPTQADHWGASDSGVATYKINSPVYWSDKLFYRVVVFSLSLVAVGALIGVIVLTMTENEIHDSLVALGSAAVEALAGVLADSRST